MRFLLAIALLLTACGPQPRCNFHRCAPDSAVYIYDPGEPGLEHSDVVLATYAAWVDAGLPSFRLPRVSVEWHDGPSSWVGTSTRHRIGLVISTAHGEEQARRLIRHELVHAFGSRADLPQGLDRDHSDRSRCPVDDDWCGDE